MVKDKSDEEAVWGCGGHDVKIDLVETRGNTMDKDGLPEISDKDDLEERPDSD